MLVPRGFESENLPLLFAHRGLRTEYPENTHAAFAACQQHDIPGIELDVHICRDDKVAVVHDDDLMRVAQCELRVEDNRYSDLAGIDIGSCFAARFRNERLPLLEDVLGTYGDSMYFDIELKNGKGSDRGLAAAVVSILRRTSPRRPVLISSFNPLELRRFRSLMPGIPTGAIYSLDTELPWYLRSGLGRRIGSADGFKPRLELARRKLSRTHRWVIPWTVNNEQEGRNLLAAGAVGLVSDDPRVFFQ